MRTYLSAGCDGFVLDTRVPGMYGGSGKKSDWELARKIVAATDAKTLLAGGISPENAAQAAAIARMALTWLAGWKPPPASNRAKRSPPCSRRWGGPRVKRALAITLLMFAIADKTFAEIPSPVLVKTEAGESSCRIEWSPSPPPGTTSI